VRESRGVGFKVTGISQGWDRSPAGVTRSWWWITWCRCSQTRAVLITQYTRLYFIIIILFVISL